ncbi:hypothetical protein [Nocardia wallacei]|uniref:hypothetical protein n=1 Tax=Nocardia wallacei TaxID=480035 RepID=UPI0024539E89|nr:hypothetical protein [Nocardia wallacei]
MATTRTADLRADRRASARHAVAFASAICLTLGLTGATAALGLLLTLLFVAVAGLAHYAAERMIRH